MPASQVNTKKQPDGITPVFTYTEGESGRCVVTLVATGSRWSGHAKIIVERFNTDPEWLDGHQGNPVCIGQYHIMDADFFRDKEDSEEITIPSELKTNIQTFFRMVINKETKFVILIGERSEYDLGNLKTYHEGTMRSWRISNQRVAKMIGDIKTEQKQASDTGLYGAYQYAGARRGFGGNGGDNCITWCQEKLLLAGIQANKALWSDWFKAVPHKHAAPDPHDQTIEDRLEGEPSQFGHLLS